MTLLSHMKYADLPIMMSNPHFYQAAQQYLDAVVGLRPEKDKHQTFIDIEPVRPDSTVHVDVFVQVSMPLLSALITYSRRTRALR